MQTRVHPYLGRRVSHRFLGIPGCCKCGDNHCIMCRPLIGKHDKGARIDLTEIPLEQDIHPGQKSYLSDAEWEDIVAALKGGANVNDIYERVKDRGYTPKGFRSAIYNRYGTLLQDIRKAAGDYNRGRRKASAA